MTSRESLMGENLTTDEPNADQRRPGAGDPIRTVMAWGVHLYTALGLVIAASIAVLLVRGDADAFRWSFALMLLATLVDATDGTMARGVGVKSVLPNFDGRKLDDLTDFLTYTFLPLLLIWRAEILPTGMEAWLLLPLLASAYGFCQVEAKTDDGYFLGFPSHWNVVAFYLYVLPLPEWAALATLVLFGFLTFIPSRYLYPSQPGRLNMLSNLLAVPWTFLLIWILWRMPSDSPPGWNAEIRTLTLISLYYPAFYMGVSWVITLRRWIVDALPRRLGTSNSSD